MVPFLGYVRRVSASKQAETTRAAILDAAEAAFAETGFAATGLREVARRAGVTQPLIHHYFRTKDALFEEVLNRLGRDYDATQVEQWARDPSDVRFFTVGLRVLFAWTGRHRLAARLVMWARLEGRFAGIPEDVDAIMEKVRKRFVDARAAGVLRGDVDIEAALLVIDALFKGFWDRAEDPWTEGVENAPERVLEESLAILLRGLLTPGALEEALSHVSGG